MKKGEKERSIINAGLAGAQTETVQRYGAAVKEHIVAYTGEDHEARKELAKSLKSISKSKVNPNDKSRNIKQQAGFSAEVKTQARENAEKIIQGDKVSRSTRTDDMTKQPDGKGRTVGGRNEQLYDIAEIDRDGVYIEGSGRQLKYIGGDAEGCYQKLLEKKFDKYREAEVPIEIPSDFYDDVKSKLNDRIDSLERQINNAEVKGNFELAEKHRAQLAKVEKTRDSLKKGKLTNDEAIEARLHPMVSTGKDMASVSHRAGIKSAKYGAVIGGGISFIQNSVSVIKGDKEINEAVMEVAGDTAQAAGISYATGFAGSAIKGGMQNAQSEYLQALSKTNLPATVTVAALETGKTLKKYLEGKIDGTECLTELGEKGTGMLASAAGATVGQILIPVPVVGGLVGSMVGYAISSAYYNSLVNVLNEAKIAHKERLRIEAECKETICAIREYRFEVELAIRNYLKENISVFDTAFAAIENAYSTGDVDLFIKGTNIITRQLGGNPLFENKQELDMLMEKTGTIIL